MKNWLVLLLVLFLGIPAFADDNVMVFSEDGKFGLKNGDTVVAEPIYRKLIVVGGNSYIALKKNKYGLVDKEGKVLLDFKYTHATRIIGQYVCFKNYKGYGLYDRYGNTIIPQGQDSIEVLPGKRFLVVKNYKYGIVNYDGEVLIKPVCDNIYYPKPNIVRIQYNGRWYEIEQLNSKEFVIPEHIAELQDSSSFKITKLITDPVDASKYSVVSGVDYSLKIFSSISPAYEATIDELMLSQGAEAVSVFMKASWIPKFPFLYCRNYYRTFRNPNNGPLSEVKNNIKNDL